MSRVGRLLAVAGFAAAFLASTAVAIPADAAAVPPPPGACNNASRPSSPASELPWAQRTLSPRTVWPHSTGKGVTVAVVDSGVDSDHPQLRQPGKVRRGQDFYLVGDLPGRFDCASHGTAVASLIGAAPATGIGFAGLAKDASVLPVRISEGGQTEDEAEAIDPLVLARGIWYAAESGADVINLSVAGSTNNRYVRDAIRHARNKDALVVAAAGNAQQSPLPGPSSYPAGYDGVLGVGAVDQNGTRLQSSQIGPQVDLVAPGGAVLAAVRVSGHQYVEGTSFAAPFVSATAALVRAKWPELSAAEVADRLRATATPAPGGQGSPAYGAGMVNPYRAVTDSLVEMAPAALPKVQPTPPDPAQLRRAAVSEANTSQARTLAVFTVAAGTVCVLAALTVVGARRAGWRPRRSTPAPADPARDELPEELFVIPPPESER